MNHEGAALNSNSSVYRVAQAKSLGPFSGFSQDGAASRVLAPVENREAEPLLVSRGFKVQHEVKQKRRVRPAAMRRVLMYGLASFALGSAIVKQSKSADLNREDWQFGEFNELRRVMQMQQQILSLIGFGVLGLTAVGQDMPKPQQATPVAREAKAARYAAHQRLTSDFGAAIKNGTLSADDAQNAQNALAQLQPHTKGAPRDPQARHEAMKTVRQMAANPGLRPEDRDLLAKDLAALKPARK